MECMNNLAASVRLDLGDENLARKIEEYGEDPSPERHYELVELGYMITSHGEMVMLVDLKKNPGIEPIIRSRLLQLMGKKEELQKLKGLKS